MQCGPKRTRNFLTICLNKNGNGVFDSVFSYGKLRDRSLTYFPVFVVLYLYKIAENIDQNA